VPDFRPLEGALLAVGESLNVRSGEGSAKKEVLRDIFRLNHEIGRLAREFPTIAQALREMQLDVNSVTIEIKRDDREQARTAFGRVSSHLQKVREAKGRIPQAPS